jgi:hypothetical protein
VIMTVTEGRTWDQCVAESKAASRERRPCGSAGLAKSTMARKAADASGGRAQDHFHPDDAGYTATAADFSPPRSSPVVNQLFRWPGAADGR